MIYEKPPLLKPKQKVDVGEVFKNKVTYNHKNASSKVRPMLMITDCPNAQLKEQGRTETINWIKMRKEAAKKFRSSSLYSH